LKYKPKPKAKECRHKKEKVYVIRDQVVMLKEKLLNSDYNTGNVMLPA